MKRALAIWAVAIAAVASCRLELDEPPPGAASQQGQGGSGGQGSAAPEAAPFSLLTWNLRDFPQSDRTVGEVAAVVEKVRPVVVAAQEVSDDTAFEALAASLSGYQATVAGPGDSLKLGLLHDTTRAEVDDVEVLFADEWYAFPRPPLKARVRSKVDPQLDFTLVVVHLKALGDPVSQERRRLGCEKLDEWMRAQLAWGEELDIIVAGDFNDVLEDPPHDNVFGPFLSAPDVYRFLTEPAAEVGDFSYIPYQSLIDHVLVTTEALPEYGSGDVTLLPLENSISDYVDDVSDHRPVLVRFRPSP